MDKWWGLDLLQYLSCPQSPEPLSAVTKTLVLVLPGPPGGEQGDLGGK